MAGADEDAFEPTQSSSTDGDGSWGSDKIGEQDSQQPGGGKGLSFDGGAKSKRRRSSAASTPLSVSRPSRRFSEGVHVLTGTGVPYRELHRSH